MTGPHPEAEGSETRPISVAELLARNGTIGAPAVSRRRRRRRGDSDAVTVAELTGETSGHPRLGRGTGTSDAVEPPEAAAKALATPGEQTRRRDSGTCRLLVGTRAALAQVAAAGATHPGPSSAPTRGPDNGCPERRLAPESDAEGMSPDPAGDYADIPVDVMDSEVREAEVATEDSAYVRSYLQASDSASSNSTLFGGPSLADELARRRGDHSRAGGRGRRAGTAGGGRRAGASVAGPVRGAVARQPGGAAVDPGRRIRRGPVRRLRPAVALEQHRGPGALGAGHPRPGGRGPGRP